MQPLGDLAFEDAVDIYREVIGIGVREGVDLILIETMSDSLELKAAVLAAKENSELPVFATVIFDEKGRLLTGGDAASVVALLEGLKVDALGINCGLGPVQMKPILKDILAVSVHAGDREPQRGASQKRERKDGLRYRRGRVCGGDGGHRGHGGLHRRRLLRHHAGAP